MNYNYILFFTAFTLFNQEGSRTAQNAVAHISTLIALILLIVVILYHLLSLIKKKMALIAEQKNLAKEMKDLSQPAFCLSRISKSTRLVQSGQLT